MTGYSDIDKLRSILTTEPPNDEDRLVDVHSPVMADALVPLSLKILCKIVLSP